MIRHHYMLHISELVNCLLSTEQGMIFISKKLYPYRILLSRCLTYENSTES